MVLELLETARLSKILISEIWFDMQGREVVGLMVLRVAVEDIERNIFHRKKGFIWTGHG